jgi:protein O-mannosyl-transferase
MSLSLFWLGVTMAPVLNARWMAANVLTERYLYLPSWGFCWAVAWLGVTCTNYAVVGQTHRETLSRIPKRIGITALLAMGIVAARATHLRNQIWQDDVTLYTQTLKTDPHSYPILLNLGLWYHKRGQLRDAETQYLLGIKERPDGVNVLNAMGVLYFEQKRYEDAAAILQRAIAVKDIWAPPHFNYGRVLLKQGKREEALRELQTAVSIAPLDSQAHLFYADALSEDNEFAQARSEYQRSIDLSSSLEAERGLASVLLRAGDRSQAEVVLRRVIAEYPYDGVSHLELARFLEQSNRPEEALQQYRKILETDPRNAEARAATDRIRKKN